MTSCNMAPYVKSVGYIDYTMYDNGILALKISPYTDYTTKQSGYFATGMAIKK